MLKSEKSLRFRKKQKLIAGFSAGMVIGYASLLLFTKPFIKKQQSFCKIHTQKGYIR